MRLDVADGCLTSLAQNRLLSARRAAVESTSPVWEVSCVSLCEGKFERELSLSSSETTEAANDVVDEAKEG